MVKLDTISMEIDRGCITHFNKEFFLNHIIKDNDNNSVQDVWKLKNTVKPLGVGKVEVRPSRVLLEVSAKILESDYYNLININNVEKVISNINRTGIIGIKNDMVYNAEINRCDCTDNLRVKNKVCEYTRDMELFRLNEKYLIKPYKRHNGIVFIRDVKSYKERQIYYDKENELIKDNKKNRKLLQLININEFANCLRVESNITSFDSIRNSFGVKDRLLCNILSSDKKVNYNIFKRITNDKDYAENVEQIEMIFERAASYDKLYLFEKEIGREGIIKALNFNMKLVIKFIKEHVKGNVSRYIREYKRTMKNMLQFKEYQIENIKEIEMLLAA